MMKIYKTFIFDSYNFDKDKKILILKYSYDNELFFEEKIEFPSEKKLNSEELEALENTFKFLHIATGVSYYKLFIPYNIQIKTFELTEKQAKFFNNFYFKGLGEFSFKNNILDLKERINFPYTSDDKIKAINMKLNNKFAIPIGGGKDSVVTMEIVKKYKKIDDIILCSIGTAKPIENVIKMSGCNFFQAVRTISEELILSNKNISEIGGYNGHIPISGIISFILCSCSIIYDFDTVLMSNERSANEGNVEFNGSIINHQWSKSFEFEKEVNLFFKENILTNFNYISLLRPLSELYITKIFSELKKYHPIFSSCNKNYRIENRIEKWCCECDKCRFTYLILAVFLTKNELKQIFGVDLLDDRDQLEGFTRLCGLGNHKPFECVGEIDESIYSIENIGSDFENDFVVKAIKNELQKKHGEDEIKKNKNRVFSLNNENLLDAEMLGWIKNFLQDF
jgi:hypothetical protein